MTLNLPEYQSLERFPQLWFNVVEGKDLAIKDGDNAPPLKIRLQKSLPYTDLEKAKDAAPAKYAAEPGADAFIALKEKVDSRSVPASTAPQWNEQFAMTSFYIKTTNPQYRFSVMQGGESLGYVLISGNSLHEDIIDDQWYPLSNGKGQLRILAFRSMPLRWGVGNAERLDTFRLVLDKHVVFPGESLQGVIFWHTDKEVEVTQIELSCYSVTQVSWKEEKPKVDPLVDSYGPPPAWQSPSVVGPPPAWQSPSVVGPPPVWHGPSTPTPVSVGPPPPPAPAPSPPPTGGGMRNPNRPMGQTAFPVQAGMYAFRDSNEIKMSILQEPQLTLAAGFHAWPVWITIPSDAAPFATSDIEGTHIRYSVIACVTAGSDHLQCSHTLRVLTHVNTVSDLPTPYQVSEKSSGAATINIDCPEPRLLYLGEPQTLQISVTNASSDQITDMHIKLVRLATLRGFEETSRFPPSANQSDGALHETTKKKVILKRHVRQFDSTCRFLVEPGATWTVPLQLYVEEREQASAKSEHFDVRYEIRVKVNTVAAPDYKPKVQGRYCFPVALTPRRSDENAEAPEVQDCRLIGSTAPSEELTKYLGTPVVLESPQSYVFPRVLN